MSIPCFQFWRLRITQNYGADNVKIDAMAFLGRAGGPSISTDGIAIADAGSAVGAFTGGPAWDVNFLGYYLTSKPYPAQVIESADSVAAGIVSGEFRAPNVGTEQTEAADSTGAGLVSGEFRALLFTTEQTESADSTGAGLVSGEFRVLLFSTEQTESADSTGAGIVSGEFREQRIPYENYPAESADSTGAGIVGGVHEIA